MTGESERASPRSARLAATPALSLKAADPDEGDLTYSVGDVFEIEFDRATNRARDIGEPGDRKRLLEQDFSRLLAGRLLAP